MGRLSELAWRPHSRRTWAELLRGLSNPLGWRLFAIRVVYSIWPLVFRFAGLARRIFLRRTFLVGVAGSFGKSTATRTITHVLGRRLHHRALANHMSRIPYAVLRIRPWQDAAVVEAGIERPGQMSAIANMMRPNCAVVMSIGGEHHTSLKSLEGTRDEKAHMVRVLTESGIAVLNGDDPNVRWMASQTKSRVVTFGFGEDCQIRATEPSLDWPRGMRFRLHVRGAVRDARIQLIGRHMIYPALAAVAVGLERGIPLDTILSRLESATQSPGRLSAEVLASGAVILRDDAKSSLETMHPALDVLEDVPAYRKIAIMGPITEPPPHARQHYRELAARLAKIAHLVICVDSHANYGPGLRRAGFPQDAVVDVSADLSRVLDVLRETLSSGDVVLIKGRARQKLERIAMALAGMQVGCTTSYCPVASAHCPVCPMLRKGWATYPPIT